MRREWMIPAGLVVLALVPTLAGAVRVAELAGDPVVTPANARFVAAPLPVVLHVVGAVIYALFGAFQFAPGFRRRHRRWHRMAGGVLIPAGFLVAGTGLWMTATFPWAVGDGLAVYLERLLFGTMMLVSLILGLDAIRRRAFADHGAWMVRAYAIGMGAGTQVLTHLPWAVLMDAPPDGAPRAVMMGLGWVVNLVVAEWVIRRGTVQSRRLVPTLTTGAA
jgi:hypothetical protein